MTADQVDAFTRRTIRWLHELTPLQRADAVEQILRADPELKPVLSTILAACSSVRYMRKPGPLLRDSVSPR